MHKSFFECSHQTCLTLQLYAQEYIHNAYIHKYILTVIHTYIIYIIYAYILGIKRLQASYIYYSKQAKNMKITQSAQIWWVQYVDVIIIYWMMGIWG